MMQMQEIERLRRTIEKHVVKHLEIHWTIPQLNVNITQFNLIIIFYYLAEWTSPNGFFALISFIFTAIGFAFIDN